MKNPQEDLKKYRSFLETIPLDRYREELKDIKWVEQDLPKEMLPLTSIFKYYWEERQFLTFEEWFKIFWEELYTNPQSKEITSLLFGTLLPSVATSYVLRTLYTIMEEERLLT